MLENHANFTRCKNVRCPLPTLPRQSWMNTRWTSESTLSWISCRNCSEVGMAMTRGEYGWVDWRTAAQWPLYRPHWAGGHLRPPPRPPLPLLNPASVHEAAYIGRHLIKLIQSKILAAQSNNKRACNDVKQTKGKHRYFDTSGSLVDIEGNSTSKRTAKENYSKLKRKAQWRGYWVTFQVGESFSKNYIRPIYEWISNAELVADRHKIVQMAFPC